MLEPVDSFVVYNIFYYANLCHVCKESVDNIKRCSLCKSVAYCSKNHQRQDWKFHKELCKVIAEADGNLNMKNHSVKKFQDFKNFNIMRSVVWQNRLGRKLRNFEDQMWMFPRVCTVCHSRNVLFDCPKCLNASYCSEEDREADKEHVRYCDVLKLCMDIDLYYFHNKYRPVDIEARVFADDVTSLPNDLTELMVLYDGVFENSNRDKEIQFYIKSNHAAPAATMLYGMEKSGLLINRSFSKESVTVHIVGADIMEISWLWNIITELPFHWIRNMNRLEYFLIGPELFQNDCCSKLAAQLCENCKARDPKTNVTFCSRMYHDVVDDFDKPDIVVAFNSGIHELDSEWLRSIDSLVKYPGVPLILTAYTWSEICRDVSMVLEHGGKKVRIILEPQRNPFAIMRPIRDWESEDSPVFYLNGYIAILTAAAERN